MGHGPRIGRSGCPQGRPPTLPFLSLSPSSSSSPPPLGPPRRLPSSSDHHRPPATRAATMQAAAWRRHLLDHHLSPSTSAAIAAFRSASQPGLAPQGSYHFHFHFPSPHACPSRIDRSQSQLPFRVVRSGWREVHVVREGAGGQGVRASRPQGHRREVFCEVNTRLRFLPLIAPELNGHRCCRGLYLVLDFWPSG